LIEAGISDLRDRKETVAALLVAIGAPRLRNLGLELPANLPDNPEHRLYDLLARDDSDSAHSRHNALVGGLDSYAKAAERAQGITLRAKLEEFLSKLPRESRLID